MRTSAWEQLDRDLAERSDPATNAEADKQWIPGLRVTRLSDVEPERVRWLWPGRLPRGKLVVLDGDPGVAKSTITIDWASRISTGSPMPDGAELEEPADVVLLSAEDGLADTILPRLLAAGGNPKRIHAVTEVAEPDDEGRLRTRPPSLPGDVPLLEQLVREHGAALVVVDVLNAYLSGRVNSHRDQDVRRALHPLSQLADRTDATVVVLRHLNKSDGANPLYRGGGSIGIVGAARAGMIAAADPTDPTGTKRVLAVTKSNLAAMPKALAYRCLEDELYGCSRIQWDGPTDHTAAQLLAIRVDIEAEADDTVDARSVLAEILSEGPMWVKEAFDAMAAAGFSKDQAKRAKQKLKVTSIKVGKPGDAEQGWQWVLPRRAHDESEECSLQDGALFAPLAPPSENGNS